MNNWSSLRNTCRLHVLHLIFVTIKSNLMRSILLTFSGLMATMRALRMSNSISRIHLTSPKSVMMPHAKTCNARRDIPLNALLRRSAICLMSHCITETFMMSHLIFLKMLLNMRKCVDGDVKKTVFMSDLWQIEFKLLRINRNCAFYSYF